MRAIGRRRLVEMIFLVAILVSLPAAARPGNEGGVLDRARRSGLTTAAGVLDNSRLINLAPAINIAPVTWMFLARSEAAPQQQQQAALPPPPPPAGAAVIPIAAAGPFNVEDEQGRTLAVVPAGQTVRISYHNNTYYLSGPAGLTATSAGRLRAVPLPGTILTLPSYTDLNWNKTLNLNAFRGEIEVCYSPVSGALWAVNDLPLEDYLKGVSEASADAPVEHLKVMSIIERSYAWHHLSGGGRHKGEPFTLKNSRNGNGDDQIYQGYLAETKLPRLAAAAAGTAGRVVTYRGEAVITPYSTNPGGRTRTPREAGWNQDWPWVQSVPDPDTAGMARNGHGVGLSGIGSRRRAERGETAASILAYYFPGTTVGTVPTAGKNIRIAIYSQHLLKP